MYESTFPKELLLHSAFSEECIVTCILCILRKVSCVCLSVYLSVFACVSAAQLTQYRKVVCNGGDDV